ncbi:MAG: hypothetical protein HY814_12190 [Candidatus Riflebacteria bacterium]|nr:hypothetical protein [Candidatus Riflebacteria bacterium]
MPKRIVFVIPPLIEKVWTFAAFLGLLEWLTLFRRKKGLRLMVFIHHVLRREFFGPVRDAYRYVKYTLLGSSDLIG